MKKPKKISAEEARLIGDSLQIDWERIDLEQFRQGFMEISRPVTADPETGAAYDGELFTRQVVLAQKQHFSDYFTQLARLQAEVDAYQARRR